MIRSITYFLDSLRRFCESLCFSVTTSLSDEAEKSGGSNYDYIATNSSTPLLGDLLNLFFNRFVSCRAKIKLFIFLRTELSGKFRSPELLGAGNSVRFNSCIEETS